MRVLLTGHRGRLGQVIAGDLEAAGHEVRGFDVLDGDDISDPDAVMRAAEGADAIVHLAGIPDDRSRAASEMMAVNLMGVWHVLLAAREQGVSRVVNMSSGKAIGMVQRPPHYLPVDDEHPGQPPGPYGLAKWLGEEMCEAFTTDTGIPTVCLRPVAVVCEGDPLPETPPGAVWALGVWVDVRDVAAATVAALSSPDPGHVRLLLCADDIVGERPTLEQVAERLGDVEWKGGPEYESDPYRSLIDTSAARRVIGWRPIHRREAHTGNVGART